MTSTPSIDVNIQDVAEEALLKQLQAQKAQKGCAVLMEVKTGFVKAIANLSYDLNLIRILKHKTMQLD